jgi:CRISPR/Cas system-associated protein Cas10 (large subunit of type III CRISPR-Cas system)
LYYLCKFVYKYSDEIISISKELSNDVKKQISTNKIKTIYNPFDLEKIKILKNEKIEEEIEKILTN